MFCLKSLLQVSTAYKVKFYSGCFILNCIAFVVILFCEKKEPGSFKKMLMMG